MTAREAAERFGISERHVRNIVAEPRATYEQRISERYEQILQWRSEGVLWREIADHLGITVNAAQKAGARAKQRRDEAGR